MSEEIQIQKNLQSIHRKMEKAAKSAGRSLKDIYLIGVTKYQSMERIRAAMNYGLSDLGHNYFQGFREQAIQLGEDFQRAHWHFIGHLQRNKVKHLLKLCPKKPPLIHTLDRIPLAQEINACAKNINRIVQCLIQVLPGEVHEPVSKGRSGCPAPDILPLLQAVKELSHVSIQGLMILPPFTEDTPEAKKDAEKHFQFLHKLGQTLNQEVSRLSCDHIQLEQYSMGMTHDFEEAIAEGATWIRIGTGIFGERTIPAQ